MIHLRSHSWFFLNPVFLILIRVKLIKIPWFFISYLFLVRLHFTSQGEPYSYADFVFLFLLSPYINLCLFSNFAWTFIFESSIHLYFWTMLIWNWEYMWEMCSPPAELLQGADRVPLAELPAYTMQAKDCLEHSRTNHTRTATQPSSHARNKSHRRSKIIKSSRRSFFFFWLGEKIQSWSRTNDYS